MSTPPAFTADGSATAPRIGVFDSGVGGLSVLRALRQALPGHGLHYVADSGHAPYGERDAAHVVDRSMRITQHLLAHGAQLVVVACNTATAVAAQSLRERWPECTFVGVEPGIKPAFAASRSGRIAVMATAATLASAKFRRLVDANLDGRFIHLQACNGLAAAIERGDLAHHDIEERVEVHCRPMREARVDTVVLGCTHYPFAEQAIRRAMGPQVELIDTADAIARRVVQVVAERFGHRAAKDEGPVLLESTGDVESLGRFARRWLPFDFMPRAATLDGAVPGARDGG